MFCKTFINPQFNSQKRVISSFVKYCNRIPKLKQTVFEIKYIKSNFWHFLIRIRSINKNHIFSEPSTF